MAEELSVWERCARIAVERYKNCRKEIEQLKTDALGGRKGTDQWIKAAGRGAFEAKVIADNIRAAEKAVTLGSLAAAGRSVWAHCLNCQHKQLIKAASFKLPPDQLVSTLSQYLICSKCGSRRIHTRPDYSDDARHIKWSGR